MDRTKKIQSKQFWEEFMPVFLQLFTYVQKYKHLTCATYYFSP